MAKDDDAVKELAGQLAAQGHAEGDALIAARLHVGQRLRADRFRYDPAAVADVVAIVREVLAGDDGPAQEAARRKPAKG